MTTDLEALTLEPTIRCLSGCRTLPCWTLLIARDLKAHRCRHLLPFTSPLQALQLIDGL